MTLVTHIRGLPEGARVDEGASTRLVALDDPITATKLAYFSAIQEHRREDTLNGGVHEHMTMNGDHCETNI